MTGAKVNIFLVSRPGVYYRTAMEQLPDFEKENLVAAIRERGLEDAGVVEMFSTFLEKREAWATEQNTSAANLRVVYEQACVLDDAGLPEQALELLDDSYQKIRLAIGGEESEGGKGGELALGSDVTEEMRLKKEIVERIKKVEQELEAGNS